MPNASSIPIILATISRVPKKTPYLSKARKEWRVVRADNTKTIIEDVEKGKTFEMNTRDLYEAHLHLEENDIQISLTLAKRMPQQHLPYSTTSWAEDNRSIIYENLLKRFSSI